MENPLKDHLTPLTSAVDIVSGTPRTNVVEDQVAEERREKMARTGVNRRAKTARRSMKEVSYKN